LQWVYQRNVDSFADMSDLSKALRTRLIASAEVRLPDVALDQKSDDGSRKCYCDWPTATASRLSIYRRVIVPRCACPRRSVAVELQFLFDSAQGFNRNLTTARSSARCWWPAASSAPTESAATRTVAHQQCSDDGHGRAVAEFRQCRRRHAMMLDDLAFGLSKRRVTLSTSA